MSTTADHGGSNASEIPGGAIADMPLEVLVVPVSDVDRTKQFYSSLGWRLDFDRDNDEFRMIQFTPPGSACSVVFGRNISTAEPGSVQGLVLAVADLAAARQTLVGRGVPVGELFHCATGIACGFQDGQGAFERFGGVAPDHGSYNSFAVVSDPDGNSWVLQEVTTRRPGRIDPGQIAFRSKSHLASAMRRAEAAHAEHEKRTGQADADWPAWYAEYIEAEQSGADLPT
jgi:catechol 2,3-dioxygenase-like lactoylglutathione lyase family enzyme